MSRPLPNAMAVLGATFITALLIAGCERKPDNAKPGAHSPGNRQPATASADTDSHTAIEASRRPEGVDRQDDHEAPRALPRTHELRTWAKTQPVRVFTPSRLEEALDDASKAGALATFHLKRAARCAYQQGGTTAQVLLIEAASSDDAFGVFSLMTARPGTLYPADGSVRAVEREPGATIASGWQGDTFAQVRCAGEPEKSLTGGECEGLLVHILFNVPRAEPPWLLRAILGEKGETAKLWLVRSTAALAAVANPVLRQVNPQVMDARLGMRGDLFLAVASVQVAKGEGPNVIWVIRYPDPAAARSAGERYRKALHSASGRLDANTIVDEPKGPFLAGSWTADQESIHNLLQKFRSILPD